MNDYKTGWLTVTLTLFLCNLPTLVQAQTAFAQGKITFTQDGKEATWVLAKGDIKKPPSPQPMTTVTLLYSPDGKLPGGMGQPLFRLVFGRMMNMDSIAVLAVDTGPGGKGLANARTKAKCSLNVTQLDERGVTGTGTCLGPFEGGPSVTKFSFSATP